MRGRRNSASPTILQRVASSSSPRGSRPSSGSEPAAALTYAIIVGGILSLLGIGVSGSSSSAILRFNNTRQTHDFDGDDYFDTANEVIELTAPSLQGLTIGGQSFTVAGTTSISRHTTIDGR